MIKLIRPVEGETVELLTEHQRAFSARGDVAPIDWLNLKRSSGEDCTFPKKAEFLWEGEAEQAVLEISERADFAGAWKIPAQGGRAAVGNLKMNTRYFWRVNGSEARSFTTEAAAPRWIEAEGISNVRDMGAWRTKDGKRVRQGLIFRGSEMDTHHSITENGVRVLREELKIRTDLDIRGEAVGRVFESPMGKNVRFLLIPARAYGEYFREDQKETCRRIFGVFADAASYPVYFHCWGGADRTGTIALLLEALLGVSEEDMLSDYELTSLSVWGDRSRESDLFRSLMAALDQFGGPADSMNRKAENYLLSCGLTAEELGKIREIMLEEQKSGV